LRKKRHLGKVLGTAGVLAVCAAAKTMYIVAPGRIDEAKKKEFRGRNIAHRGLHSSENGIPENSLAAFDLAAESGYGIELDVRLTADGRVVVFHDEDTERICGVPGSVSDMTWSELKKLRLLGTSQSIPLFSEVLSTIDGRGPIVVEIKRCQNNRELCERTLEMIRCYSGSICIESFDPTIVAWFRKKAPDILRGQLTCPCAGMKGEAPMVAAFLMAHGLLNFITRPHFIAHSIGKKSILIKLSEKMGAMRAAWTVRNDSYEESNDIVIFEGYKPRVRFR